MKITEKDLTRFAAALRAEERSPATIEKYCREAARFAGWLKGQRADRELALAYKAVNTMDSMVGYKNDRYLYFGRAAARLDDAVNVILFKNPFHRFSVRDVSLYKSIVLSALNAS